MRTALRTAIATALVAGVAVVTPAFAAGTASAADGTTAFTAAPTTTAATPAPATAPGTKTSPRTSPKTGDQAGTTATGKPGGGATGTTGPKTGDEAGPKEEGAKGTLVRTQTLLNGTVAKIYKVREQNHRAELFYRGNPVGVLEAVTRSAAGNDNGEFFVLNPDGTTYNWDRNYLPGAKPGLYRLVDGTVLELAERNGRFGLQLIQDGKGRGFTYVTGGRSVWTYGRAVVVLEQDGGFAAYVPGSAKQAAPKPYGTTDTGRPPAPTTGVPVTVGECTVRQDIPSVFALMTVTLTNDLEKGPKAELKDEAGKVVVVADRARPKDLGTGIRIADANTTTPRLGQRTQGGDTPYRWTAFPKLPKGCGKKAAGTAPAPSAGTGTPHGGQTSVVPKGGVAAGAEFGAGSGSPAPVAAGVGAASLAAAGLGFVVLRRRAAGTRA
ncbi:hypothetical protein [Streptomyces sp. NPDC001744]|uniref:hypothetical protein n=1 Tax=Streptomyces sp. NPDC001744 TaxID=3364606 RepID=UPI003685F2EB